MSRCVGSFIRGVGGGISGGHGGGNGVGHSAIELTIAYYTLIC